MNKNSQSQPRGGRPLSSRWWHMLLIGCLISCGLTAVKAFDSPTPSPQPLAPVAAAQGSIGVVAESAYVSLTAATGTPTNSQLYRVNLNTGVATLMGDIGPASTSTAPPPTGALRDMAVAPGGEMAYAITANNVLVQFRLGTPGVILSKKNITGITAGDVIKGMDFRMNVLTATGGTLADQGKLYVFGVNGVNGRVYTVDLTTGIATLITTTPITPLSGTDFGFDFNPQSDRLRIVGSGTGSSLRANPNNGALVQFDTALSGGSTVAYGAAYTNNFTGTTVTTLYVTNTTNLYLQGSINGTPNSPNGGVLTNIGALGVTTSQVNSGFDIATGNGMTAAALPNGTLGFAYAGAVRGTGGTAPFTFSVTAGALPPGLTLATTGTISGTPTQSGTFNVTITGTDSSTPTPLTNSASFSLLVSPATVGISSSTAFAALTPSGGSPTLYEVGLQAQGAASGRSRVVGVLGNSTITDISFSLNSETVFGVTSSTQLVSFNRNTPGTVTTIATITGLQPSELIRGIDFRPASALPAQMGGQLYALGSTGRVYVINTLTAAATQIGVTPLTLTGTDFGFDFNPTSDRLRIVNANRSDLRANPDNGALAATDGQITYASGDINAGAIPAVSAAAYTNSFQNSTATVLYDLDGTQDTTVIQNPPNNGTLVTVGHFGVDVPTTNVGFDISNSILMDGNVGAPYNQSVLGYGGVAPYSFSVSSGSLPSGLSMTSAGVITGTPTSSGSFTFSLMATDNFGSTGTASYTVNILDCGTFSVTPTSLPNAMVGQTYPTTTLTATGGTGPYTFVVTSGSLTPGLRLSSAGVLSGVPTSSGLRAFTITAVDGVGCQTGQAFSMQGCGNITLSALPTTLTRGVQPIRNVTATGGAGPYTFFVAGGSLPTGLSLSNNGQLSGIINTGGTFTFTIGALDRLGCVGQRTYTIVVR